MYPPIFYFITPFLNFSGVQRERERERVKPPPFKRNLRVKSQIPPFFTILGPDFVARKVPLYRRFWEHACGPSDPGVGGGGGGGRGCDQANKQNAIIKKIYIYLQFLYVVDEMCVISRTKICPKILRSTRSNQRSNHRSRGHHILNSSYIKTNSISG